MSSDFVRQITTMQNLGFLKQCWRIFTSSRMFRSVD